MFVMYSAETWAVVKQHISPFAGFAVFQMSCLQRICGISLRDHVPNMDILNRCKTLYVESQLQGKRLRWHSCFRIVLHIWVMFSGCLMIHCLRSYCLVNLRGYTHLVAPGLVSMILLCMSVKPVKLVDRKEMRKTDGFVKTRLVPHVPSSS